MKKLCLLISIILISCIIAKPKWKKVSDNVNKAYEYTRDRKYEKALKYLDKALEIDSEYYVAYYCQAMIYEELELYTEALSCVNKAIILHDDLSFYLFRYRIYNKLNLANEAKSDSSYITEYHIHSDIDISTISNFYCYNGQFGKALDYINKGSNKNPINNYFHFIRARANFYLEEYEKSYNDIEISIDPTQYHNPDNIIEERYLWFAIINQIYDGSYSSLEILQLIGYNKSLVQKRSHILKDRYFISEKYIKLLETLLEK